MSSLVQFITLLDPSAGHPFSVLSTKPCPGDGAGGVVHQERHTVFAGLLISVAGSHSFYKCLGDRIRKIIPSVYVLRFRVITTTSPPL